MKLDIKNINSFLLLVFATLIISSCKDKIPDYCPNPAQPACPDYDPCWNINAANADFIIFDTFYMSYVDNFSLELDTIFNGNFIHFRAKNDNASYEWKIGSDPTIHTTPYFELNFPSGITGDIDVRLITTQEEHSCLSTTEVRDTVIKSFHLLENTPSNIVIGGRYKGIKSTEPTDSIIIEIVSDPTPQVMGIIGLFNNCPQWPNVRTTVHNRVYFESSFIELTCEGPIGWGWLHDNRNTVEIHYTVNIGMQERSDSIIFIGNRIN